MNILVICQYYFPEPFRINDICEELVKRGHKVTVVTGEPNYPEGLIYKGYENHKRSDEVINGVTVHRCPIFPRKTGAFHRLLNYFSYPYYAKRYIKNLDGFDVVFVNQLGPVMMAEPAISYKKKHHVPVVMYCLDLWPESLVAGGVKRNSKIFKAFLKISDKVYSNMDRILITSSLFRGYLIEQFNVEESKIEFLPQYAEGIFERIPYKQPGDILNFVFAGNIGEIQSLETIIGAAKLLHDSPVHFHIVGGGTDLERLIRLAKGLTNITFYGRKPLEEMPHYYALADAMLVSLKSDPVLSLTLPGKVQSYMAVGKPIIGAINGETNRVIKDAQCGFCGPAEDENSLANNILEFLNSTSKSKMCANARRYYEEHFSRERFMTVIESELSK